MSLDVCVSGVRLKDIYKGWVGNKKAFIACRHLDGLYPVIDNCVVARYLKIEVPLGVYKHGEYTVFYEDVLEVQLYSSSKPKIRDLFMS